jgi:hypothetical protein
MKMIASTIGLANGVGWAFLDFSTPYLDYLCAQTEEVIRNYPDADGIFMDIAFQLRSILENLIQVQQ